MNRVGERERPLTALQSVLTTKVALKVTDDAGTHTLHIHTTSAAFSCFF